jgi:hypothetical protein
VNQKKVRFARSRYILVLDLIVNVWHNLAEVSDAFIANVTRFE